MFRFIAFAYDATNTAQENSVSALKARLTSGDTKWTRCLECSGLQVFHAGDSRVAGTCHPVAESGTILGSIFPAGDRWPDSVEAHEPKFSSQQSSQILESGGRELIRRYWGNYVAFLKRGTSIFVVRGPASGLPCLRMVYRDVSIYVADIVDGVRLQVIRPSLNWKYVRVRLVAAIQSEATGLDGVIELRPGECEERLASRQSKHRYWDPWAIASNSLEDPNIAAATVRSTATACVAAWASRCDGILHNLSGGLDSSIVLACLSRGSPRARITCVNHYVSTPNGDERVLARQAALRSNCPLVERVRSSSVSLERMLETRLSHRPESCVARLELGRLESQLAHDAAANAVFTGEGGDELFFRGALRYAATDQLARRRFTGDTLALTIRAAQSQGHSVWKTGWRAWYDGLVSRRWSPLASQLEHASLLSEEARDAVQSETSDDLTWSQNTRDAPIGKLWQIYMLSIPPVFYDPLARPDDPHQITPLMSQPLIEACLRIPTHLHAREGIDRAVARQAFSTDLAPQILQRNSKGHVEEHMRDLLIHNLPFARDTLIDGMLMKHGLISRQKTADALADRPAAGADGMFEIFWLLTVESWLIKVTSSSSRANARQQEC